MLPVVRGEAATRRQILALLVRARRGRRCCRSRPACFGVLYLVAALALGAAFVGLAARLVRCARRAAPRCALYLASLAYLALLFVRDGARSGRPDRRAGVDRAARTATSAPALLLGALAIFVFGMTFVFAVFYIA